MSRRGNMKARNLNSTTRDEDDETTPILSEEEQVKIIEDMKLEAIQQTETFRKIFSAIFVIVAIIFIICTALAFNEPYKLHHQKHFADLVPNEFFLAYYVGSSFCFIVAALVARYPYDSTLKFVCKCTAFVLGLFIFFTWTKIFYIRGVTNPILYWIPTADMAALLLAQYVDFDSKGLVNSAEGLENYKYENKSV